MESLPRTFIGRQRELALFQGALKAQQLPFSLLNLHGPGGVGKTALLHAFLRECQAAEVPCLPLNARVLEPQPTAFLKATRALPKDGRCVLIVDTLEVLSPELETWLRDSYIPQLSLETLIVLSGRLPLAAAWRHDIDWNTRLVSLPLRNLSAEDAIAYLAHRDVAPRWHSSALAFTHGHPLALVLTADLYHQRSGTLPLELQQHPELAPNIVQTLLENLLQPEPEPHARAALEACALLRATNEVNLAQVLQDKTADIAKLFAWLRSLSCMEAGPRGLVLHEIARECLLADLRWRNPERYETLGGRARAYYIERIWHAPDEEQPSLLLDYIFLSHGSQVVRAIFENHDPQKAIAQVSGVGDTENQRALIALVQKHESDESADWLRYWLEAFPQGALVLRTPEQPEPLGLLYGIPLEQLSATQRHQDPAVAAAWQYLEATAPLQAGECATYFRFWMVHDTYQNISPLQLLLFVQKVRLYRATPRLAFSFFPVADPGMWGGALSYAGLKRIEEADFTLGGRSYAVFGHDWRLVSPARWLTRLAESEQQLIGNSTLQRRDLPTPLIALSEDDFRAAVHQALRAFTRPETLASNPLTRSRLVRNRAPQGASSQERGPVLQALIEEAYEALQAIPRQSQLAQVLAQTYLQPTGSQEKAAEELGLPPSTFRRYLRAAVEELTRILWREETSTFSGKNEQEMSNW